MNSKAALARAARGPIMLMAAGGLFALDYFGPYGFGRTWPLLLILFGFMKLVERVLAKEESGAGGIL